MTADFTRARADLLDWFTSQAMPLWSTAGTDWAQGGFAEKLDAKGLPMDEPRRTRVVARQLRLFAGHVPAVLSTHGGFHHTQQLSLFKQVFERLGLRHALSHYRSVLASSVADEAYFRTFSDRVVLCGNGVATDKFGVVPTSLDRPLNRWIYWGRLSRNKRVDQLIDTVALARSQGHQVDLLVCGRDFDGIADQLKAQVSDLKLQDAIRFETFLSDDDLLRELHQRGVYATASEHEGFGLSIVEAMAAGLQILCRDMTPINTFVQAGVTGQFLAFEGGQDEVLADTRALQALMLQSEATRDAGRLQARATAEHYNWQGAAKRFEQRLQEALAP